MAFCTFIKNQTLLPYRDCNQNGTFYISSTGIKRLCSPIALKYPDLQFEAILTPSNLADNLGAPLKIFKIKKTWQMTDGRTDGRPAEEETTELSNERCFKKLYPMKCKVLFLVQLLILV